MFDTLRNWNAVSVPSARRAELDGHLHRVPRRRRRELLFPGVLEADGAPGVEGGERDQILGDHFLLAAEAAADSLAEHAELVGAQVEQVGRA